MYRTITMSFALAILFGLSACDNESNGQLKVQGVSSDKVSVKGTWVNNCRDDGAGNGFIDTFAFDKAEVQGVTETWSGDLTCSGASDTTDVFLQAEMSLNGTKTAGWNGTAPSGLPDSLTASRADWVDLTDPTVTDEGLLVIDDRFDPHVLYVSDPASPTGGDGYPTELNVEGHTKQ